jgi:hypothetical protein
MSQTEGFGLQDTGSEEESALHATPQSSASSTVAIDVAKDVFEFAFADADADTHILERRRPTGAAFARVAPCETSMANVSATVTTKPTTFWPCGPIELAVTPRRCRGVP